MPREKELYRDNLDIFTKRALDKFPNKCLFNQSNDYKEHGTNAKKIVSVGKWASAMKKADCWVYRKTATAKE